MDHHLLFHQRALVAKLADEWISDKGVELDLNTSNVIAALDSLGFIDREKARYEYKKTRWKNWILQV